MDELGLPVNVNRDVALEFRIRYMYTPRKRFMVTELKKKEYSLNGNICLMGTRTVSYQGPEPSA